MTTRNAGRSLPRSQPITIRWRRAKHRGLASMLAMLYLVLFSTMAVGFIAAATVSSQISRNERLLNNAQASADGGMQFIRYSMGAMTIDPTVANPQLADVATALDNQLKGSGNMRGHRVVVSPANTLPGYPQPTVFIPAPDDWIDIDLPAEYRFRAAIWQTGTGMRVKMTGAAANSGGPVVVQKAIQMDFFKAPKAGAILNYGVATKGTVTTTGSTLIQGQPAPKGSLLSTDTLASTPVSIGGQGITGDVSVVNPSATVAGGPIGGTSDPTLIQQHIHKGVPAPTFPAVDISVFTAYATNPYTGGTTLNDVYIPPNTNPKFSGGVTINGVLYVKAPNVVTFRGSCTINGVIVCDTTGPFNPMNNQLSFAGSVSVTPLSALPPSNPAYDPQLVQLTGSFMLAPTFYVSMTGDFGTIGGSMVVGQLSMTGNAHGTVDGSVIGMTDNPMTLGGNSDITISSAGTTKYPTGINFGSDFTPTPGSYVELLP